MRGKHTKERIVEEAFALFAERGYRAVSVRDIAAAAGIRDASLYNHFASKQALFDAVLAAQLARLRATFISDGVMFEPTEDPTGYAGAYAATERRVLAGFRPFFEDEGLVRLHRLLAMSRFSDERSAEAYRLVFIERPQAIQRTVFEHLMAQGLFMLDDAVALARAFYGPVFLLLEAGLSWDAAAPLISEHLRRFYSAHALNDAQAATKSGAIRKET